MRPREKWLITGIFLVLVGLWLIFLPGCPFRNATGIPCPGCGMTRAWFSALRFDFAAAFSHHPMFWSLPVLLWAFWRDFRPFRKPWMNWVLLLGLTAGNLACYGYRLFFGQIA